VDSSLFPDKEQWGTGDEAMDNKLSIALKNTLAQLSDQSISDFYFFASSLRPRAINPSFLLTIEFVTKGLFHLLNPLINIDISLKKMKGFYYSKMRTQFIFQEKDLLLSELKLNRKYRFHNQIDFSVTHQTSHERNPYLRNEIKRSEVDLNIKIIFKDFKLYLKSETKGDLFVEPFFIALRSGRVLSIENFAEIWYHEDQIYSFILDSQVF
jgi:hypothetical protein